MKLLLRNIFTLGVLMAGLIFIIGAVPTQAATPPNRIKADNTRLYDSVTGQAFKPRGANYVRLSKAANGATYHSTFEPGKYDAAAAGAFLAQIAHDKYNTVRVFIDPGSTDASNPHGIGRGMGTYDTIYGPYMDNFANFVQQAATHNIYVLPAMDVFPQNSYYWGVVGSARDGYSHENVAGNNLNYMERGHVTTKAEYLKQFAEALIARIGASENAILAYQPDNEAFFETNHPPFNKLSGTVRPIDGAVYDMSKPAERQHAADASMVIYSILVKKKLLEASPNALMTIGFFTNSAVNKPNYNGFTTAYCATNCPPSVDYRVPGRPASLSAWGKADFLDIHIYPNSHPFNLTNDLNSVEEAWFHKPYIIGEFGAFKNVYGNNLITAAYAMRDFRVATCKEGAQGWLFWTWDTYENVAYQDLFFKMTENRGAINGQLAPLIQPDPCSTASSPRFIKFSPTRPN